MFRLSRGGIRAIAITGAGLVFSVLSIWVINPLDQSKDPMFKTVAVVIGVAALGSLIAFIEWSLLRLWIRKFAGEWFYTSDAKSLDPLGHVGHVSFFIRGGEIKYTVNIYTFADALRMAKGDKAAGADAKGTAVSEAIFFDGEERVKILYDYKPFVGEGGLGLLDVNGVQNGQAMSGSYVRARKVDDGPVGGLQRWFRRKDFIAFIEREFPQGIPTTKVKK